VTKRRLQLLFGAILVAMIAVTVRASFDRSILDAGVVIEDPWGLATLFDAYAGFVTFYIWVAYRETSRIARCGWFVLIMTLGNIAMAAYVLLLLRRLPPDAGAARILLRG
jgi:Protein of unknown function (DUF1475)